MRILLITCLGLLSLASWAEEVSSKMNNNTNSTISELEMACRTGDVVAIENVYKLLITEDRTQENIQLLSLACKIVSSCEDFEQQKLQLLVREMAALAIDTSTSDNIENNLNLLTSFLRIERDDTMNDDEWCKERQKSMHLWLRIWNHLENNINPDWKRDDPKNYLLPYEPPAGLPAPPSGAPPQALQDPKARAAYEEYLAKKKNISENNYRQQMLRKVRNQYLPEIEGYITDMYLEQPFNSNEAQLLIASAFPEEIRKKILNTVMKAEKDAGKQRQ